MYFAAKRAGLEGETVGGDQPGMKEVKQTLLRSWQ
jgi:hypothetical protein